jgi:CheY-like chemotaxis protein
VGGAGLWPVEVDAHQLEAALLNLAVNARDAMPDGGKLTIETSNAFLDQDYCSANPEVIPGQYVMIAVSDNGAGMTQNVVERAFEPFFSTKSAGQGTGLGLSQVYGFIKQSKGHIKIYSEVGEGTSVKIYLPRLLQDIDRREEETQPAEAVEGPGNETILVVEDDRDVRAYLVELLRDLNYRVLSAHDAISALGLIETGDIRIDLLLTDVVLPGMNGRQLAEQAKNRRPDLVVLFTTGYSRNAIVSLVGCAPNALRGHHHGTEAVSRAAPDGSTLLTTSTAFLIAPHLRKLNYDPLTSFEPICQLVSAPIIVAVNSASPYRTLADWLNAAREKPGSLTLASIPASLSLIAFEMLKRAANVDIFVPKAT